MKLEQIKHSLENVSISEWNVPLQGSQIINEGDFSVKGFLKASTHSESPSATIDGKQRTYHLQPKGLSIITNYDGLSLLVAFDLINNRIATIFPKDAEKDKSKVGVDIFEALLFSAINGLDSADREMQDLNWQAQNFENKIQDMVANPPLDERKRAGVQRGINVLKDKLKKIEQMRLKYQ